MKRHLLKKGKYLENELTIRVSGGMNFIKNSDNIQYKYTSGNGWFELRAANDVDYQNYNYVKMNVEIISSNLYYPITLTTNNSNSGAMLQYKGVSKPNVISEIGIPLVTSSTGNFVLTVINANNGANIKIYDIWLEK